MGCTKSKTIVPAAPENANKSNDQSPNNATLLEVQGSHPVSSMSSDIKNKKNRSKSGKLKGPLQPINHIDLLPDIELFSSYQCESADLAVNNAKPRLNCPGIGRAVRLAPIVPGVEQQNGRTQTADFGSAIQDVFIQQSSRNEFNIQTVDYTINETNSGRTSLQTSDSGFFNYRHPPVSVSPRNSISRTTMKTGITPDSSGVFSFYCGSEYSPLNTSRTSFLPASRACSARTGSVLTTGALNTSFMTSLDGDDDLTTENTIEQCQSDITDAGSEVEAGSRAASATPKLRFSGDPPGWLTEEVGGIGTIVEEYEGGFTPRGPSKDISFNELKPTPEHKLPHFTPKEIYEHNDRKGNIDWCMYFGKVYDVTLLKKTFQPMLADIQQTKLGSKRETIDEFQDSSSVSGSEDLYELIQKLVRWDHRSVYNVVRAGISKDKVNRFLNKCCVGFVVQPHETRFWEDIWADAQNVLDDLISADAKDTLSAYCAEYKQLLQRWVKKYRQLIPKLPIDSVRKDLNQEKYPLPHEIASNPGVLREWLDTWVPFDFELPHHGYAWDPLESNGEEHSDEDDSCKLYQSSGLQEPHDLDHTISGEAAWETIPENLVERDVMTSVQLQTEASRKQRSYLFDPDCMKRRRLKLMQYFLEKYHFSVENITPFLKWADTMKEGEEHFLLLCQ